jgi:hypothetical protein
MFINICTTHRATAGRPGIAQLSYSRGIKQEKS